MIWQLLCKGLISVRKLYKHIRNIQVGRRVKLWKKRLFMVQEILGNDFTNVYETNNNLCGIYLPDKYKDYFPIYRRVEGQTESLYVYDTIIINESVY